MILIKEIDIKKTAIVFFSTFIYVVCQMLLTKIITKEGLLDDLFLEMLSHFAVVLLMCTADYALLVFLNRHLPYSKSILFRVVADLTGLIVICVLALLIFNYTIYDILHLSPEGHPSFLIKFAFAIFNNIPILLVFELIYYFQSEQKAIIESEKAKRRVLLFEHETLRTQINPHFLFNSLNVLSSLIYLNADNANKFTKALSKTYRYVLSLNRQPLVSVAEELTALESYIFLMRMRFENSFTFTVNKTAGSTKNRIIPLTLQLLIENAFKHNAATEESLLHINITVDDESITVQNNIQPSSNTDKEGIGLRYIAGQYEMYAKEVFVTHTEHLFTVKIPYIKP